MNATVGSAADGVRTSLLDAICLLALVSSQERRWGNSLALGPTLSPGALAQMWALKVNRE